MVIKGRELLALFRAPSLMLKFMNQSDSGEGAAAEEAEESISRRQSVERRLRELRMADRDGIKKKQ